MKYSVCIDAVCGQYPLMKAMQLVVDAGYTAVEFWSWWDKDIDALQRIQEKLQLDVAAFCTRFINPGDASLRQAYILGLQESLAVAKRLHCPTLIAQAGWYQDSYTRQITEKEHRKNLIETLKVAAEEAEKAGICLALEPLNVRVDHPGYHLSRSEDAFDLLEKVGSPYVKLLFDIYHQQITEGDVTRTIREHIQQIAHFHAAGNPGRAEITAGELNYAWIFEEIRKLGYIGYMGLEYIPQKDIQKGLLEIRSILK